MYSCISNLSIYEIKYQYTPLMTAFSSQLSTSLLSNTLLYLYLCSLPLCSLALFYLAFCPLAVSSLALYSLAFCSLLTAQCLLFTYSREVQVALFFSASATWLVPSSPRCQLKLRTLNDDQIQHGTDKDRRYHANTEEINDTLSQTKSITDWLTDWQRDRQKMRYRG